MRAGPFQFALFLRSLFKHWQALILGGFVALAVTLWRGFGFPLGRIWYALILVLSLLPAAYLTWRDEHRSAEAARIEAEKRAAIWKPSAELKCQTVGPELKNELILRDSKLIELVSVELLSPNCAKLADIRIDPNQISTAFRIHISHAEILKVWNRGFKSGSVQYTVRRGDTPYTGAISFVAEEAYIANTVWIRLVG